jgi:hypothetical protein
VVKRMILGLALLTFLVCVGPYREVVVDSVLSGIGQRHILETSVVSSGGTMAVGVSGTGDGTLGQATPVGAGASGDMILRGGFWAVSRGVSSGLEGMPGGSLIDVLFQSFPNPFTLSTTVEYAVSCEHWVDVAVFDVRGRRVRTLVAGNRSPGRYGVVWDGCDEIGEKVSPGIYFCRMEAGDHSEAKKMVISK